MRTSGKPGASRQLTPDESWRVLQPYLEAQRAKGFELGLIYDPPKGSLASRESREGVLVGSFDSVHSHAVVVLEAPKSRLSWLKVVRITAESVVEVFSYGGNDDSADIQVNADLTFADINADGARELVFMESDGSNSWIRTGVRAFSYRDDHFEIMPVTLPPSSGGPRGDRVRERSFLDIDGDGSMELLVIDASWESVSPFNHACSPGGWFVLQWNGSAYVDESTKFSTYMVDKVHSRLLPSRALDDVNDLGGCLLGRATSELLAHHNGGQTAEGWKSFDELTSHFQEYAREKLEGFLPVLEYAIPRP
jgi:hypothetical protein